MAAFDECLNNIRCILKRPTPDPHMHQISWRNDNIVQNYIIYTKLQFNFYVIIIFKMKIVFSVVMLFFIKQTKGMGREQRQ